jgi:hypothetical protein
MADENDDMSTNAPMGDEDTEKKPEGAEDEGM